jgi:hypothetical protein
MVRIGYTFYQEKKKKRQERIKKKKKKLIHQCDTPTRSPHSRFLILPGSNPRISRSLSGSIRIYP